MQEEFNVSEIEKYLFIKTEWEDFPLMIVHDMKRPSLTTSTAVQIMKNCLYKFEEFINAKYGEPAYGRRTEAYGYFIDECEYTDKNIDHIYQFKRTVAEIVQKNCS